MRMLIVQGDKHSGGGSVLTGSSGTDIDGRPIARVGDMAMCPKHKGIFPIVTGDHTLIFDGQAAARHGDKLACGCSLISTQQHRAWVESGRDGGSLAQAAPEALIAAAAAAPPQLSMTPGSTGAVCEECLLAATKSAAAFLGR